MEAAARKAWELDNNIKLVDNTRDALYNYDDDAQKKIKQDKPWKQDPNYFKTVRISAVALIKMVMHARSGGSIEVMGLMQGFVDGHALIVTDAFRLPVEGTETRVNAHEEANEYMVEFPRLSREQGSRMENLIGWYHSHPGYGCWLSGIDVNTQHQWQTWGSDEFVAVVIDPDRTISAGKVEIGAFRTYPENYKPESATTSDGYQTVPLAKAEDFGAHASRYYSLEVEHFKSSLESSLLDLLWNKYWVQTLSQNPLLTNRDYGNKQMVDLALKIKQVTNELQRQNRGAQAGMGIALSTASGAGGKVADEAIEKVIRDSKQMAAKEKAGLMTLQVKANIFNSHGKVT